MRVPDVTLQVVHPRPLELLWAVGTRNRQQLVMMCGMSFQVVARGEALAALAAPLVFVVVSYVLPVSLLAVAMAGAWNSRNRLT